MVLMKRDDKRKGVGGAYKPIVAQLPLLSGVGGLVLEVIIKMSILPSSVLLL